MKLFSLYSLLAAICILGCQKENIQEANSSISFEIEDALNSVKNHEITSEIDAITYYSGLAIHRVFSENPDFFSNLKRYNFDDRNIAINEVCENSSGLREKLNFEIWEAINTGNAYLKWKETLFRDNIGQGFDFVAYFDEVIADLSPKNKLVIYSLFPSEENDLADIPFILGMDISTPNEDALILASDKPLFVSESKINDYARNNLILFVGVGYEKSNQSISRGWATLSKKLKKWYHHGRFVLDSNDAVTILWETKYRWYSGWKAKIISDLSVAGDSRNFYYEHYRIRINVTFWEEDMPNFSIFQKHWAWDDWSEMYSQ